MNINLLSSCKCFKLLSQNDISIEIKVKSSQADRKRLLIPKFYSTGLGPVLKLHILVHLLLLGLS